MAKVERDHPSKQWRWWATTRAGFAALVVRMEEIVRLATKVPVTTKIRFSGFERRFVGVSEFLENVTDEDWTRGGTVSVAITASIRESSDLYVSLDIWPWLNQVSLSISGATRPTRNAVLPDLTDAVAAHARQPRSAARPSLVAVLFNTLASGLISIPILLAINAALTDPPRWLTVALPVLVVLGWVSTVGYREQARFLRAIKPIEFLPGDGRSQWDREMDRLRHLGKRAAKAVVGASAVVAAVFGGIEVL